MKVLRALAVVVLVFVVVVLVVASTKPSSFRVERTTVIAASPEKIMPLIDDFHQWEKWSPWEKLDPAAKKTYTGAPRGVGAEYAWSGNSKAGQGRMEVLTETPTATTMSLDFIKPFKANDATAFTLTPEGNGTRVSWVMTGANPFMSKVMIVFMSMDKMIGGDFERGLGNLKTVAER